MNAAKNRAAVLARLTMPAYEAALKRVDLDRVLAAGMESDDMNERVRSFLQRLQLRKPDYRIGRG